MKCIVMGCCMLLCLQTASGQLWNEFFRQKRTQKKYLLQQIAALSMYAGYLKEGYHIAQEGLTFINDVKTGHFSLDKDYFASFLRVNPALKGQLRLDSMEHMHKTIEALKKSCIAYCARSPGYRTVDVDVVQKVFNDLLADYDQVYEEMMLMNTSSAIAMSDRQRGSKMTKLVQEAESLYGFARSFDRSTRLYGIQVWRDKSAIQSLAQWYGIK